MFKVEFTEEEIIHTVAALAFFKKSVERQSRELVEAHFGIPSYDTILQNITTADCKILTAVKDQANEQ